MSIAGWIPRGVCGALALLVGSQLFGHAVGCYEPKTPADRCVADARSAMYVDGQSYDAAKTIYRACLADAGIATQANE